MPPEVFLAVLLHELRNPLAVIRGWVEILANEKAKEHHPIAFETISQKIAAIENIQEGLAEYVKEHSPKPAS